MRHINKLTIAVLGLVFVVATAGSASAVITFDEYAVGTAISNQYSGVVFHAGADYYGYSTGLPYIWTDLANPTSPVLTGDPAYSGDFFMEFLDPVYCLSFDAGYWDDYGLGRIDLFDEYGDFIGSYTNTEMGIEHFSFSGLGAIGWAYFSPGDDPAAAIDNLDFCSATPEPGTLALFGTALAGAAAFRRRRKR